jgi:uncharacterized protein YbbC (DUF1343 family)
MDTLVFDIQDIGCRFYTYIATMLEGMQAAAGRGMAGPTPTPRATPGT